MVTDADSVVPTASAREFMSVHVQVSVVFSEALMRSPMPPPIEAVRPSEYSLETEFVTVDVIVCAAVKFSVGDGSPGANGGSYGKVVLSAAKRLGSIVVLPEANGSARRIW